MSISLLSCISKWFTTQKMHSKMYFSSSANTYHDVTNLEVDAMIEHHKNRTWFFHEIKEFLTLPVPIPDTVGKIKLDSYFSVMS